jgi:hypothetical protein
MHWKAAHPACCAGALLLFLSLPAVSAAQMATVLFGTVTDAAGRPIPNAKVSARNTQLNQPVESTTDASGNYTLPALTPGPCMVTVTAPRFTAKEAQVNCAGTGRQPFNVTLSAAAELPAAPAPASTPESAAPSLTDLGFSPQQTQPNPRLQAMLDRHTEMLKIHQRLGLITVAPMAAALITGPMAKAKGRNGETIQEPTNANLDFHAALGSSTAALYFTTAYFAVFAPRVPGVHKHGAIRMHEALAFIHGPGMILTPILGAMAFEQEQDGEKVHGLASAHAPVAIATACAYAAAIVSVSWPIHLKFWEKK